MKGSFSLGSIAGIKISIHWTFSLLILYIIFSHYTSGENITQILWAVLFILSIFLTVFLHELGHALAAKRFDIVTKDITLLPIGGIARLERIPEKPKEELIVAIAGPMVNLAIAAISYLFVTIPGQEQLLKQLSGGIEAHNFLLNFFMVNVWLAVFNLIPAFPMDGGRVLRALLSYGMERHKATAVAARIGQILAIGFVLLGFNSNPFLIFIGIFIFIGAQTEMEMVTANFLLKGKVIGDITMHRYETLEVVDTVGTAVEKLLNGTAKAFLVLQDYQPVGTLNRNEIIKALSEGGNQLAVSKIMNTQLASFDANEPVETVFAKMNEAKQELAVITRNNVMIGVVDTENILEFVMVRGALRKDA